MKKLIQKLSVMSIALILFSTTGIAINRKGNHTKKEDYGVTIENKITIKSGNKKLIPINVKKGFNKEMIILFYFENNFCKGVSNWVKTPHIFARVISKDNKPFLEITAEKGINKQETDTIQIKALPEVKQLTPQEMEEHKKRAQAQEIRMKENQATAQSKIDPQTEALIKERQRKLLHKQQTTPLKDTRVGVPIIITITP